MKLSVIIVNYNVRYFLELCLRSVQAAITSIEAEVIVVDNNSPDGSCEMVSALFPDVKLISNKENTGFSKANNQGVELAQGDYVCVLNPDTVLAEDTFTRLLSFVEAQQNLGIVSCKLIDGAGRFLPESKRHVPTPSIAIKKLLGMSKSYYASEVHENAVVKVPVFVGAFMLLSKKVYQEVEGFDERYFMYGEDIDLSYSVVNAGYDNYYYGETTIIHYKGESTLKDAVYAKRFYGAMRLFYKKYFKTNVLFDVIVNFGIKIMPIFGVLLKERNLEDRPEETLETEQLSFKKIIELIEKQDNYYKIQLSGSGFSIRSKSSKSRGEVIFES
ncbi:MAG: glycosyltransferase family 2 protein [Flavobacteriaceae bacterium]